MKNSDPSSAVVLGFLLYVTFLVVIYYGIMTFFKAQHTQKLCNDLNGELQVVSPVSNDFECIVNGRVVNIIKN